MTEQSANTWETIDVQRDGAGGGDSFPGDVVSRTDRLAVPGGWLYRTQCYDGSHDRSPARVAMVFVPQDDDERERRKIKAETRRAERERVEQHLRKMHAAAGLVAVPITLGEPWDDDIPF